MPTSIMNPNSPMVEEMQDTWPSIALLIMQKQGLKTVCITREDMLPSTHGDG